MNLEVLISTMNKKSKTQLIKDMNIANCVIINQITKKNITVENDSNDNNQKFYSFYEKGLSKSRNIALKKSSADICVIADDDMYYEKNYEETIISYHKKYPNIDIIAFIVEHENPKKSKKILKQGNIGYLKSMKLQSVQLTIKRASLIKNNIYFDENFGAGSLFPWGEENIFLFDCLRKKMKILYVPCKIATLRDTGESSWDKTNSVAHYNNQGAIYYRMSKKIYWLLIIQFAIRKRNIYANDIGFIKLLRAMFEGAKKYKKNCTD